MNRDKGLGWTGGGPKKERNPQSRLGERKALST